MFKYVRRINYHETDKMGITHHANYIKFMEEARVAWMDKIGWSFKKCEQLGMISPVLSIKCEYKKNTTFDDIIDVYVKLIKYNGVRLIIAYEMKKDDDVVAKAESEHCFLNKSVIPVRIKNDYPEFDKILTKELEKNQ